MQSLARKLLALESERRGKDAPVHQAIRVCERLRVSLARFAGADGFAALLQRSVALARPEFPALNRISVKADCVMEGFEELVAEDAEGGVKAGVAITAHLLDLLVTFIGMPLTMRMVRDAWPDDVFDE